jgi:hypothetical protein
MSIHPVQPPAISPDPSTPERSDAHNPEVDEAAATHHLCGMQHLATGRKCHLPERHSGGCDFTLFESGNGIRQ